MIAVIADDLTGAAEMGGVGLHHALTAEVQTETYQEPRSDLVVFNTDSRSMTCDDAQAAARMVMGRVEAADLIYKKVDSVMRGHILTELETILGALGRDRALLIPANPTLGRTITEGEYLVGGIPLHETDFSRDPEYPATTSRVLDLLGTSKSFKVSIIGDPQPIPEGSIVVGEAENWDDLLEWARCLEPSCLPTGASDFFAAILEARGYTAAPYGKPRPSRGPGNSLFVCGSSSEYSRRAVRQAENRGLPISWMPQETIQENAEKHLNKWAQITSGLLNQHSLAIVAIGQLPASSDPALAHEFCNYITALVEKVLCMNPVQQLYMEGGATSSSIVQAMGWNRFFPVEELSRGVVRMKVEGEEMLHVTIKPGSYHWPKELALSRLDS